MRPIHPPMPVSPMKLPTQVTRRPSSEWNREELSGPSRLRSPQLGSSDSLRKRKYSGDHDVRNASALSPPASLVFAQRGMASSSRSTLERRPSFAQSRAPLAAPQRPRAPAEPAHGNRHLAVTSHAAALTDALNRLNIGGSREGRPAPVYRQEWPNRGRRSRVPSHEDQMANSPRGARNFIRTPASPANLDEGIFHMDSDHMSSDDDTARAKPAQRVYDLFAARK